MLFWTAWYWQTLEEVAFVAILARGQCPLQPADARFSDFDMSWHEYLQVGADKMQKHNIELLWGTANLFSHPRYMAGAATNPDPEVFKCAAYLSTFNPIFHIQRKFTAHLNARACMCFFILIRSTPSGSPPPWCPSSSLAISSSSRLRLSRWVITRCFDAILVCMIKSRRKMQESWIIPAHLCAS